MTTNLRQALTADLYPTYGQRDTERTNALVDRILTCLAAHATDVALDENSVRRAAEMVDPVAFDDDAWTGPSAQQRQREAKADALRRAQAGLVAARGARPPVVSAAVHAALLGVAPELGPDTVNAAAQAAVTAVCGGQPQVVTSGQFSDAVRRMSVVEKLHPRAPLDSLLHAALPAFGLEYDPGAEPDLDWLTVAPAPQP